MNITLLHLSLVNDIGPHVIQKICAYINPATLADIYQYNVSDFIQRCGLTDRQAASIVSGLQDTSLLEQELALIEKHNIQLTTLLDVTYPPQLKEIHLPPAVVYWRGDPDLLTCAHKSIAVIGSRIADRYGQRIIDTLVPPLIEHGWTIVSGGALGADTMAHQKTVDMGGKTIVVLGSGLLHLYPWKNKRLFEQVLYHNGVILSVFPLQVTPIPGNFPARNRIIAGLSRGCVVVQAGQKSGTRITAEFALEQGRDVFAVPGLFDDQLSMGCHKLIADGAKLITSVEDIFETYGEVYCADNAEKQQMSLPLMSEEKSSIISKPADTLEQKIIAACAVPRSLDYLITYTSLSVCQLQALLFELQLSSHLEQDFTGQWIAIR